MADVVEVETTGWLSRIAASLKGILVGIVLVVAGPVGLWMNEGCAVRAFEGIAQGRAEVVQVDPKAVDPTREGQLVMVAGPARAKQPVRDPHTGVQVPEALRVHRSVEMYQWVEDKKTEKRKKLGGSEEKVTTYTYRKEWRGRPVDTSKFKKREKNGERIENPPMPFLSGWMDGDDVRVGAFVLSAPLLKRLDAGEPVTLDASAVSSLPEALRARTVLDGPRLYVRAEGAAEDGGPRIGDMRIAYGKVAAGPVSAAGAQTGRVLDPWRTRADTTIALAMTGTHPPEALFDQAETEETRRLWIARGAGLLALLIGFLLIFRPFAVLGDVVPIVGSLIGAGSFVLSLGLALAVGLTVIGIAWLAHRPLLAGVLLGGAALVIVLATARNVAKAKRR